MGEERRTYHWGADQPTTQRLTVAQAAAALGITEGAVRSRIKRGTLPTTKEGGTVFVLLGGGTSQANQAPNTDVPTDHTAELIATLREQLQAERAAHAESRRLLLEALTKIPPAIEAPSEPPGAPETVAEEPERAEHRPSTGGPQSAAERPWWRRWIGG